MFLDIKLIDRQPGVEIKRSGVCDFSALTADGIVPLPQPVKVEAVAANRAGLLRVTITAEYELTYICDRCAAEVNRHEKRVFEHPIRGEFSESDMTGDEDTVNTDADGKLPIDDLLWEDIMLAMPSPIYCREDCRGLCLSCGGDLNTDGCVCGQKRQVTMDE